MDAVKAFNSELSSLYDVKPPISKAKMTSITKSAIKGIKFYKHIVQSVEKFIQKCRPEYKVPGLYVVDSIVRQSRHQFGADKDVFGPRFVKNVTVTFQNLFKCAEEDRPKIIRVLNLWQKNNVFPIDVIQPLLDMGHPNTSNETASGNEESRVSRHKEVESNSWKGWPQANDEPPPDNRTYAEMSTKNLEKFTKSEMVNAIEDEVSRSSLFRTQLKQDNLPEENTVKFNKKLLDFDYGDEEDEEEAKNDENNLSSQPNALALSMAQNLLCNPELLRKLQQMQQTIQQNALNSELGLQGQPIKNESEEIPYATDLPSSPTQQPPLPTTTYQQEALQSMELSQTETDKDDRILPKPPPPKDLDERSLAAIMTPHHLVPPTSVASYQQPGMDKDDRIIPDLAAPPQDLDERSLAAILAPLERGMLPPMPYAETSTVMQYQAGMPYPPQQPPIPMMEPMPMETGYVPVLPPEQQRMMQHTDEDERLMYSMPGEPPLPPQDFDERSTMVVMEERSRKDRSRSRSGSRSRRSGRHRSRSKSPRRRRSRSRSPRSKNHRSRSKERERIREKERERERERERKKKGIPPIKKGCVSVCSTTLWIGHVPKSCSEMEISSAFGPYGTILSIDMIPPRGCAYVVMDRRQDAYKALQKLRNTKFLQSSSVKMAWAPGKGVKGKEYKDYWEVDSGVSYVPYDKIPSDPEALELLEEGGFIDEESLPEHLKALRQQSEEKASFGIQKVAQDTSFNAMQAPPMVPPPNIPPTSVNLPMLLPHPMQTQFGLHLPGLLPPQAMVMQVPMGIPPPNPMLMVQQQSQNILGSPALSMIGGVPPIVPRTIPGIPNALPNMKNTTVEPAISSTTGDATPTEEDGTNVSSPSTVQKSLSSTTPVSTQAGIAATQYSPMLNLPNTNRLPVPPVSSSGTPIPYPPPQNVGFNFPPPGMRPPGMTPNSQFPWMQKPPVSPFTESDSNQSRNGPGMPPHMFNNRPPFLDVSSSLPQSSPMKDNHNVNNRDVERRPGDMDAGNRSPLHSDKMAQEMVISTDDESSMDRDFSHGEMKGGPRFQGAPEFPRMPMNMHRMRNPMGPMQGGRFPPGMPPFPPRMGGPRGPGMHPGIRMEMDFPGPRGPRMPGLPGPPRRMEGPHHPNDGRDWYPRDFDGPPFERDRHFYNDRNRDSWTTPEQLERESRHMPRNHERHDERMRDMEKRDGPNLYGPPDKMDDGFDSRGRQRPPRKSKPDDLMDDIMKLQFYQGAKNPSHQFHNKQLDRRRNEDTGNKPPYKNDVNKGTDQTNSDLNRTVGDKMARSDNSSDQDASGSRRDRESRKRSRWGRTLSEEREFQQQKRNEIEMKFQSYEQSAQAAQLLQGNSQESSENVVEMTDCVNADPTISQSNVDVLVPESTIDSNAQSLSCEKQDPENSASELQINNSNLNLDTSNPTSEPDTVQSITTKDAMLSADEPFAVNTTFETNDPEPSSDMFVTNPSKPLLTSTESPVTNHLSEPSIDSIPSECIPVELDTGSSSFNLVSESANLNILPVSVTKETDHSTVTDLTPNSSIADSENNSLNKEPINHIDTNSEASLKNNNVNEDISESSSTNKSPLLLTDS